eukprot:TRINITY_DN113465_c0_g1_i1.p1 TRINITY_DN113465_c0_g1~~TRINITY_DN113465_c0_g1_i1.p1  ORF type:complete len:358 (-),score=86.98 TRINITY_DN113465_c0_g1_i1:198-1217(-)
MADVREQFQQWLQKDGRGTAMLSVELLRVDDGAAVLKVSSSSAPGSEREVATLSLAPVEGASFFAEGLAGPGNEEELPEEVEDWLTDLNSSLSDKPKLSFGEALSELVARAPKSSADAEDEDDAVMEDEDDDMMVAVVEDGASREGYRQAQAEDQRWQSVADSSVSQGSRQASQVLMREMRALLTLQGEGKQALEIEMVNDSLYHWSVKMNAEGFPPESTLRAELCSFASQHASRQAAVVMEVLFPDKYPMDPPFIRVVRPRFQMHTGHITIGGSVCMQLLTPSGWLPSVSLENVFVSIRSEMVEGGGRLDLIQTKDYTVAEAREAFQRVASRYGWLRA